MRSFGDKIHESLLILPNRKRPKVSAENFGAEGVSDGAGSGAHLLLDLKSEAKEAGNCRIFVEREIGQESEVFAAGVSGGDSDPRRIHGDGSPSHTAGQSAIRIMICPRPEFASGPRAFLRRDSRCA